MASAVSDILAQVRGNAPQQVPAQDSKPSARELDPQLLDVIKSFEDSKELMRFAEQQKELHEKVLREAMGDAKVGTIDGEVVLTVNNGSNTRIDKGILQAAFPEAYTAALVTKRYTYLKGQVND
jgi:hypothetical protein